MKKLVFIILLMVTVMNGYSQQFTPQYGQDETPSYWETQDNHKLVLNYNKLGRNYAQGVFYGAGGYAMGMWLSGNKTGWGLLGSVLSANIPLLLEKKMNQPEAVIGRNLGALTVGVGFTVSINLYRGKKMTYQIIPILRKHN